MPQPLCKRNGCASNHNRHHAESPEELHLTAPETSTPAAVPVAATRPGNEPNRALASGPKRKRFFTGPGSTNRWLFLLAVVLPTVLASLYYGLIASNIYISESRFVVRSPQKQGPGTLLGSLLEGTGFNRAQDDSYAVHDFITSRDALQRIGEQLDVRKAFSDGKIDRFSRFPGLDGDESFEALHEYYQKKRISISHDASTAITVLRVSAFTPGDAQRINELLLGMSEQLVNRLNDRGREDMVRYAKTVVEESERKARDASQALSNYRSQKAVFDPERQSAIQLQAISKLQDELIATKTQLAQVVTYTPDNPQVPMLRTRIATLQGEINNETAKVAGGATSLTSKAADYERLALDRTFADRQLASALTSLEQARNDAQRKLLYLERIVKPMVPDEAVEPRRWRAVLGTFVIGLMVWGILSILLAGVREHND